MRTFFLATLFAVLLLKTVQAQSIHGLNQSGFKAWFSEFRAAAANAGISTSVYDSALGNAQLLPDVVIKDRNQSEFTKAIWDYLDSAASDARDANGKKALKKYPSIFAAEEAKFGVDKEVIATT